MKSSIVVTSQKLADLTPWSGHDVNFEHFAVEEGAKFLLRRMKKIQATNAEVEEAQEIVKLVDGLSVFLGAYCRPHSPVAVPHARVHSTLSRI